VEQKQAFGIGYHGLWTGARIALNLSRSPISPKLGRIGGFPNFAKLEKRSNPFSHKGFADFAKFSCVTGEFAIFAKLGRNQFG
jgi:hypothetical protein